VYKEPFKTKTKVLLKKGIKMNKEGKILDLSLTMIEQSNDRMKRINQKDKDGYGPDIDHIKLE